jgi:hypothetical protein
MGQTFQIGILYMQESLFAENRPGGTFSTPLFAWQLLYIS